MKWLGFPINKLTLYHVEDRKVVDQVITAGNRAGSNIDKDIDEYD